MKNFNQLAITAAAIAISIAGLGNITIAAEHKGSSKVNSDTPLSDAIAAMSDAGEHSENQFREAFLSAEVGVHVTRMLVGAEKGETVITSDDNQIQVTSGGDRNGNPVLLAFADPPVFIKNFGDKFLREFGLECNATMPSRDLIRTALYNPDSHGIRLNSAIAEQSVVLDREMLESMLENLESE
jgi:hypothetical protein